jgi:outer membrane lipoprotein-sorting protein
MRRALLLTLAAAAVAVIPLAAQADPAGDLANAAGRFAHLKYWHATLAPSNGHAIEADFAAPDRFRMTLPTGPAYFIGQTVYVSMGGHYMKLPVPQAASYIQNLRSPGNVTKFAKTHKVQDLGNSSADGVPTHAYAFDDTSNGVSSHVTVDVGQADGYLRRAIVKSAGHGTTTIHYSKFDVPVTINAPS